MQLTKAIENDQSNIKTNFWMIIINLTLYFGCKLPGTFSFSKLLKRFLSPI